jgi:hypothetical protein
MITPEMLIARLIEVYGDNLADPEHHPIQFNHQVKVQLYYMKRAEIEKCTN